MNLKVSFLQSKVGRRFFFLFFLCALLPIFFLSYISYNRVVEQLEEQSYTRLQRETKAYGLGVYDRLIRAENDLEHIAKNFFTESGVVKKDLSTELGSYSNILLNVSLFSSNGQLTTHWGEGEAELITKLVTEVHLLSLKPFILDSVQEGDIGRFFIGINIFVEESWAYAVVGEIRSDFLWGVGEQHLLPPMTELLVFNDKGASLVGTSVESISQYSALDKEHNSKNRYVFNFELGGETFWGSVANVFFESRFQRTGWKIMLAQKRTDMMSALDEFRTTFPLIMSLFLLIILYLYVRFICKALEPLSVLKLATKRIAQQDYSTKVDIPGNDEFTDLGNAFNAMTHTIGQQIHTIETVSEIDRAILASIDKVSIIQTALRRLRQSVFNCDIVLFARTAEHSEDFLKVYIQKGRRAEDPKVKYYNITSDERNELFSSDIKYKIFKRENGLPSFLQDEITTSVNQYLGLPIIVDDNVKRILLIGWKKEYQLAESELEQSRQIADQISVALSNSYLVENLERLASGTIEALARTVDAKSLWTAGHSERVAELSGQVAKAMGFSEEKIDLIKRGGLMHDVGKIGISLLILDKPDRLTDEEYEEVKTHPSIGAKILEPIDAFSDILAMVEQHHEKYDGSGYPNGLKGESIDINARILAVVDVWDALVSTRPYREGWVNERAIGLIMDGSGTHFDPEVVKAFLAVIEEV